MEEYEQRIHQTIDDWGHETFFKGDGVIEDDLYEGISWLYLSAMRSTPKVLILDSPLGCQKELSKLGENTLTTYPLELFVWGKVKASMDGIGWTGTWCKCLPLFKTSSNLAGLRYLESEIRHITENAFKRQKQRFIKFSDDNLLNRYEKIAFYDFIRTAYMRDLEKSWLKENRFGKIISHYNEVYLSHYILFLKAGCFLSWFYKEFAFVSRRPKDIKRNNRGNLHNESGAAIEWRDGWKQYYLNGIRVSEEIGAPAPEDLDPKLILKTKNVEVRREIVRKIGIERVIQKLGGKVIDSWNGYELILLDIPDMRTRPLYLKMKNPSIGTYHVEGIPPQITTCKEALSWRVRGLKWNPEQLT